MTIKIKISPSVLAGDLSRLGEETIKMANAGADYIHLDVMDGHFVPNLTFGPPVIKCLREKSAIVFDVHLMIEDPLRYLDDFAAAGADVITFHVESQSDTGKTLEAIKEKGIIPGLSLKPNTPANAVFPFLDKAGMILVMTVEPGFGGQKYMRDMEEKIREIKAEIHRRNLSVDIQVDGGIDDITIQGAAKAGANIFVAGSYLFKMEEYSQGIRLLREKAESGYVG